jgi:hypothetical protein
MAASSEDPPIDASGAARIPRAASLLTNEAATLADDLATRCQETGPPRPEQEHCSRPPRTLSLYFFHMCRCGSLDCREEAVPERCPCYRSWFLDNVRPDSAGDSTALTEAETKHELASELRSSSPISIR